MGTVGAGIHQRGGELGVEHGRLVDDDEVGLDGIVPVTREGPGGSLRLQQAVQRARGPVAQLLQPLGRPAGRRGQGDPRAGCLREAYNRGHGSALARPRSAGKHAHADVESGAGRVQLALVKARQDRGKIFLGVIPGRVLRAVISGDLGRVELPGPVVVDAVDAVQTVEHVRMGIRPRGGRRRRPAAPWSGGPRAQRLGDGQ